MSRNRVPKPSKAITKTDVVRLRCTPEQKAILTVAAREAGLTVSGWLLMIGLREARAPKSAKDSG